MPTLESRYIQHKVTDWLNGTSEYVDEMYPTFECKQLGDAIEAVRKGSSLTSSDVRPRLWNYINNKVVLNLAGGLECYTTLNNNSTEGSIERVSGTESIYTALHVHTADVKLQVADFRISDTKIRVFFHCDWYDYHGSKSKADYMNFAFFYEDGSRALTLRPKVDMEQGYVDLNLVNYPGVANFRCGIFGYGQSSSIGESVRFKNLYISNVPYVHGDEEPLTPEEKILAHIIRNDGKTGSGADFYDTITKGFNDERITFRRKLVDVLNETSTYTGHKSPTLEWTAITDLFD